MKLKELFNIMDKRTSLVCKGTLSNKFVLKANYVRNTAYTKLCKILIESLDVIFLQHNFCIVDTEKLLNNVSFDELLHSYPFKNSEEMLAVALNNKDCELCEKIYKILETSEPSIKINFKAEGTWNGNRVILKPSYKQELKS